MLTSFLLVALFVGDGGGASAPTPLFEPPVQLKAGDAPAGAGRLYPSPVLHDVTGDGNVDLVIGDLRGQLTFSERDGQNWSEPKPLLGADSKPLKFNNW